MIGTLTTISTGYTPQFSHIDKFPHDLKTQSLQGIFPSGQLFLNANETNTARILTKIKNSPEPSIQCHIPTIIETNFPLDVKAFPKTLLFNAGQTFTTLARRIAQYSLEHLFTEVIFLYEEKLRDQTFFIAIQKIGVELQRISANIPFKTGLLLQGKSLKKEAFFRYFEDPKRKKHLQSVMGTEKEKHWDQMVNDTFVLSTPKSLFPDLKGKSLIVCMHWETALQCQQLIPKQHPKKTGSLTSATVSVISLVEHASLAEAGISSCSLSQENIGYSLAHALINDVPLQKSTKGYLRIRPELIRRSSTTYVDC